MPYLINPRHEALAQLMVIEGDVPDEMLYINAGYTCAQENAGVLFRKALREHPEIEERVKEIKSNLMEFRNRMVEIQVLQAHDRKRILSQIAGATLGDFVDAKGEIDMRALKHPAISEFKETVSQLGNVTRTIKIRNPHDAIDLLNKMDHLYIPENSDDNRPPPKVIINIVNVDKSDATHLIESATGIRRTAIEGTGEAVSDSENEA